MLFKGRSAPILGRDWHWFFALGITAKRLTVLRGIWEGDDQSRSWECPAEVVKSGFIFDRDIPSPIGTFVPGGPLVLASGLDVLVFESIRAGFKASSAFV